MLVYSQRPIMARRSAGGAANAARSAIIRRGTAGLTVGAGEVDTVAVDSIAGAAEAFREVETRVI